MSRGSLSSIARAAIDSPSPILPRPRSHFEPLPEARFGETDFANDAASWSEFYAPAADLDEFTGVAKLLRSFGLDTLPLGAPEPLADEELNPFAASDEFVPAGLDDRPSRAPARAAALPKAIDAPTATNDATEPSAANVDRTGKPQSTLPVPGEPDRSARVTAADPLRIDDEAPGSGPIMAVRRETAVDARRAPAPAERPSTEAASEIDGDERHAARAGAAGDRTPSVDVRPFDAFSAARSTGETLRKDDEARDSTEAPAKVARAERGAGGPAGAADDRATRDDATRRDAVTAATQADSAHAPPAEHETPISPHVDDRSAPVTAGDLLRLDEGPQRSDPVTPVAREPHDPETRGDAARAELPSSTEGSSQLERTKQGARPARAADDRATRDDATRLDAFSAATREVAHARHAEREEPIPPHDIDERSAPVTAGDLLGLDDDPQGSVTIEPVTREPHDAGTHGDVAHVAPLSSVEVATQVDRTEPGARPTDPADDRATRYDTTRFDASSTVMAGAAHAPLVGHEAPIPPSHVDGRSTPVTAGDLLRLDDGPQRSDTIESVAREPRDAGTHGEVEPAEPPSSAEAFAQVDRTGPGAQPAGAADDRATRDDATRLDAFSAATHEVAHAPHAVREEPIPPHDIDDRSAPVTAGDLLRLDDGPQRSDTIIPVAREPHDARTHGDIAHVAPLSSVEAATQVDRTGPGAQPARAADDRATRDDATRLDAFSAATHEAAHAPRGEHDSPISPLDIGERSAPVTAGHLLGLDDDPQGSVTIEPVTREPHDAGGDVAHAALPSSTEASFQLERSEQGARPTGAADDPATRADTTRRDAFTAAARLDAFSAPTHEAAHASHAEHEAAHAPHAEHEAAHAPRGEHEAPISPRDIDDRSVPVTAGDLRRLDDGPQRSDTIEPVTREVPDARTHRDVARAELPSSAEESTQLERNEQGARPTGQADDRVTRDDTAPLDAFSATTREAVRAHAEREDPVPPRDIDDRPAPVTAGDLLRIDDGPQRSDTIEPVTREPHGPAPHRDVAHAELPSSAEAATRLDRTELRARPIAAADYRATSDDTTRLDAFSATQLETAPAPRSEHEAPISPRDIGDRSAPVTAGDRLRLDADPQRSASIEPITREPQVAISAATSDAARPPRAEHEVPIPLKRAEPRGSDPILPVARDANVAAPAPMRGAHPASTEATPQFDRTERGAPAASNDAVQASRLEREVPPEQPRDLELGSAPLPAAEGPRTEHQRRAGPADAAADRSSAESEPGQTVERPELPAQPRGIESIYAAPPRGGARLHAATEPPNAAVPLAFGTGSTPVALPAAATASIASAAGPIAPAATADRAPAPPDALAPARDAIAPPHESFVPAPDAFATPAALSAASVSPVRSAAASDGVHGPPAAGARRESSALAPDVIRTAPPPAGRREAAPAERTIRVSIDRIEVASPPPPPRTPVRRRPVPRVTLDAYAERRS